MTRDMRVGIANTMSRRTDLAPVPVAKPQERLKFVLEVGQLQRQALTESAEEEWTDDDERLVQDLMSKARPSQLFPVPLESPTEQTRKAASAVVLRKLERHFDMSAPTQAPYTRLGAERDRIAAEEANVAQYMPTLLELKAACLAIHNVFLYIDKYPEVSDAWALSWRAGDVNYIPYNHFNAINFIESNESMVNMTIEVIMPLSNKITDKTLSPEETEFLQSYLVASRMIAQIKELNTNARYWSQMREEYGEWSAPRDQ